VNQGPFARAGLCCPDRHHYYDPLRLPLDRPSLPGITGYRHACFPGSQPGAEEGLSSSQDNLLTIPRPLTPEGSSTLAPGPKASSMAFAHRQQARLPLVPHKRGCAMTTLQASLHAADWPVATLSTGCCRSASTPTSQSTPGASYQGPWRLPGPDSHRLADLSLSFGYVTTTSSLSWRPNSWTHCRSGAQLDGSTERFGARVLARRCNPGICAGANSVGL
jgi:hypothetical protein